MQELCIPRAQGHIHVGPGHGIFSAGCTRCFSSNICIHSPSSPSSINLWILSAQCLVPSVHSHALTTVSMHFSRPQDNYPALSSSLSVFFLSSRSDQPIYETLWTRSDHQASTVPLAYAFLDLIALVCFFFFRLSR